jgi:hypothetical protein
MVMVKVSPHQCMMGGARKQKKARRRDRGRPREPQVIRNNIDQSQIRIKIKSSAWPWHEQLEDRRAEDKVGTH